MRVAFPLISGVDWTGGRNYLVNLLRALRQNCPDDISPVLFAGTDAATEDLQAYAQLDGLETVQSPAFNRERRQKSLLNALLLGSDRGTREAFLAAGIDVIFEPARFFGRAVGIPAIAWLPDFQHRHLSHLFPRFARLKREIGFRAQIAGGRSIMLSSHDACADCERFYPATRGRTYAVQFAVPPPSLMPPAEAREIADSYGLPAHFIYLPNQFWVHKNHALVIEAVARLREQGHDVVIAASGNPQDPRDPGHYPGLQARIQELGVEASMRLLGLIPYPHLGALMQAADAVLNPSLFEGWSTTVEEARSQGVPMILSDLAVHREQAEAEAIYFDRTSADALADALLNFSALSAAQREQNRQQAQQTARLRVQRFAGQFVDVARATLARGVS